MTKSLFCGLGENFVLLSGSGPLLFLAWAALQIDFSCSLGQGNLFLPPQKAAPVSSSLRGSLLPFPGAKTWRIEFSFYSIPSGSLPGDC